mgnify:CR=1 FL=1
MDNLSAQFAMANVAQSYYWSGGLICVDNENLHVYDYSHNESEQRMLHDLTDSYGVTSNHYYMDIMKVPESRYKGTLSPSFGYISYPHAVMTPHLYVPSWLKKTKGASSFRGNTTTILMPFSTVRGSDSVVSGKLRRKTL